VIVIVEVLLVILPLLPFEMVPPSLRTHTAMITLFRVGRVFFLLTLGGAAVVGIRIVGGGVVVVVVGAPASISTVATTPTRPHEVLVLHVVVLVIPIV